MIQFTKCCSRKHHNCVENFPETVSSLENVGNKMGMNAIKKAKI